MLNNGDKVYVKVPTITAVGVVHDSDQPFFVVSYDPHLRLAGLSLTPGGSQVLSAYLHQLERKKPTFTVYDHLLEED